MEIRIQINWCKITRDNEGVNIVMDEERELQDRSIEYNSYVDPFMLTEIIERVENLWETLNKK